MKNMNKQKSTLDPIAEARKSKGFSSYSKSARINVRLAGEVYTKRKSRGWSQIKLAKEIGTTQRIISNIESGDVNIGVDLLKRLVDGLNFSNDDLGNIFESCCVFSLQNTTTNVKAELDYQPQHQQIKYSTVSH